MPPEPYNPDRKIVSFYLSDIVTELLGDNHYKTIGLEVAKVLRAITNNKHTIYVQFPGEDDVTIFGNKLTQPRLWRLEQWLSSTEKWLRAKERSEREREARFILEANRRLVAYHVKKFLGIDNVDVAHVTARKLIEKNDIARMKAFGVPKLYNDIKEIP